MNHRDIIVIGASAGGIEACMDLLPGIPPDLPATLLIVQHISPTSPGLLAEVLGRVAALPFKPAEHGEPIRTSQAYVAMPDYHLLVHDGHLFNGHGPRENYHRPSIDALFRSAAVAYGRRVVGVVLSGMQDDGTAGLLAIKDCGGLAIVQDPADAIYPDMPRNALAHVQADYLLPRAGIGEVLNRIVREPLADEDGVAGDGADATLAAEVRIAEGNAVEQSIAAVARDPSPFSCPDCGGVLWNVRDDGMQRYRCRIGHAYSAQSLVAGHDDAVRRAFDVALRSLDERAAVAESLAHSARERGWTESAARFDRRAAESREHARVLEQWLRDRTVTSVGWHDVERVP